MTIKSAVIKQYQRRIDDVAKGAVDQLDAPSEGWIATMRKALGMSGAQLARIMGQTRANISKIERTERDGTPSLKTMTTMANAMGCRFVYAIIPPGGTVRELIEVQARKKAEALVKRASTHMGLEKQSLTPEQEAAEIDRLTAELIREMPSDLWVDE